MSRTISLLVASLLFGLVVLASAHDGDNNNNNNNNNNGHHDVCVIGGGASGMATAVFLKDRGYNPLVLEAASEVGGHCNTIRYNVPSGSPLPGFVDIGVVVYSNSSYSQSHRPQEGWAIKSDQFASRFASIFSLDFGADNVQQNYLADFTNGLVIPLISSPDPSDPNNIAFATAFGTLYGLVSQYPWLSTGHRPDPVPAALLVPFVATVQQYNLWPLQVIFEGLILTSGIGGLEQLSTLEAFQILSPPSLDLFNPQAPPGAGFFINGGCSTVYQGMAAYIGADNVILNANIEQVSRSSSKNTISGHVGSSGGHHHNKRGNDGNNGHGNGNNGGNNNGHGNGNGNGNGNDNGHGNGNGNGNDNGHGNGNNGGNNNGHGNGNGNDNGHGNNDHNEFSYDCDKIVVAFYPTLANLAAFDLSSSERNLFSLVSAHYYLALGVTFTGGSLIDQIFTVYAYNSSNPSLATGPFLSAVTRSIPVGPAAAYVNGDIGYTGQGLSLEAAIELAQTTLDNFPGGLITGAEVFASNYHLYEPHFPASAYSSSPSPDTRFAQLQGHSDTYWVGAATRYDSTTVVWNGAYEVVTANFPVKHHK